MTEHLGGAENPDQLRELQARYERLGGGDRMFKIVDVASGAGIGSVGVWTKDWRDQQVYEAGPIEYGHSLTEQIGGQLAAGFILTHLDEAPHHTDATARYMPGYSATRAIKP